MDAATCYKKTLTNISAEDAFNLLGNEEFCCLVYSPDVCAFAKPDEVPDVFEMRCFNENFELRWVRNAPETGNAVILAETQPFQEMESIGEFYKRSSQYLLWGTAREIDGKICLFEHRVGKIEIPLNLEHGEKAVLNFDEFFSPDPDHGNMMWRFERLKGLENAHNIVLQGN